MKDTTNSLVVAYLSHLSSEYVSKVGWSFWTLTTLYAKRSLQPCKPEHYPTLDKIWLIDIPPTDSSQIFNTDDILDASICYLACQQIFNIDDILDASVCYLTCQQIFNADDILDAKEFQGFIIVAEVFSQKFYHSRRKAEDNRVFKDRGWDERLPTSEIGPGFGSSMSQCYVLKAIVIEDGLRLKWGVIGLVGKPNLGLGKAVALGWNWVDWVYFDLTTIMDDVGSFPAKISVRFGYTKPFLCSTREMVNQLKTRCPFPDCSTEDPLSIPRLLRWHTSKGDKLIDSDPYLNGWSTKRVHPHLIPTIHKMKQYYMKKFKAFTDEPKDTFIDSLKAHLKCVTIITSLDDGEDGEDEWDLGGNVVSRYVTRGAGTSKPREPGKTPMIENLEECVFRLEELIKDIVDFMKEERCKVSIHWRGLSAMTMTLKKRSLRQHLWNRPQSMLIRNKDDESAGVEKENHDEGRHVEEDKNEKNVCEEKNNEGDEEKGEEKNAAGEVEKDEEEEPKEEGENEAPEKEGTAEKENKNEFSNIDEFLNEVTQVIDKMQMEDENVECLDIV
ncbi:hypothetical protein FXO38_02988 [Capsicum annuum]|nr:hypothetical protein FXO37_13740 [Capsicum annuum]KAF3678938.1 hypothetical protein FXO38_02988 [Capsicum annuum]